MEGLIHISELSDQHIRRVEDVVQVGQTVRVRSLEVNEQARRIALSIKGVLQTDQDADAETAPPPEEKKRKRPLRGGLD